MGDASFYPLLPDEASCDACLDQARFIRGMLALEQLEARLADLLCWLDAHPWSMTGLPSRTARRVLASLLAFGVLVEESLRSPVRFGIPLASLRFSFPRLWPEAEPPEA
jgi:hypothetical protein